MVAEYADEERIPDTPPQVVDATKRRRRTRAEIDAEKTAAAPKPTRQERNSRYPDIFHLLYSINTFAATIDTLQDDVLSYYDREEASKNLGRPVPPSELEQLAMAADAYQANSPKVHKWVTKALEASPGVALLVVCVGLALPRLERHGLLPWLKRPEEPAQNAQESTPVDQQSANGYTPYPYSGTSVGAP